MNSFYLTPDQTSTLLRRLSVTLSPSVQDVIQNIAKICQGSQFARQELFDNYPERLKTPADGQNLLEILKNNFLFIEGNLQKVTEAGITLLRNLPCVPVYSTPTGLDSQQVVLVKPTHVLNKCDAQGYHPYLHILPKELYSVSQLLEKIGVRSSIELQHIQLLLEIAFKCSQQQELDLNTEKCVRSALKQLYHILAKNSENKRGGHVIPLTDSEIVKALTPLYLPSDEKKLDLSTNLLYRDKYSFGRTHHDNLLHIPSLEYGFSDSALSQLLPKGVRPLGLSEICEQTLDASCKVVDDSFFAGQVKQALKLPILPKATVLVVKHCFTSTSTNARSQLESIIAGFVASIKVVTVLHLQTEIKNKQSGVKIGKGKVGFLLCGKDSEERILYLDSNIAPLFKEYAIRELSETMVSQIKLVLPETKSQKSTVETVRMLSYFLKAESSSDILQVLDEKQIAIGADFALESFVQEVERNKFVKELGREIPECWHHRLDQDPDNVFRPMEYVGYDFNGHIILAQIVHAVLPTGGEITYSSVSCYEMTYDIYISQDGEEGIESNISALDLYKFRRGLTKAASNSGEEATECKASTLEVYDGQQSASQNVASAELETKKREIDTALSEIWKLPPEDDQRMKALRRLYLKWHPDKNPDNVGLAEEVFKYLKSEIERHDDDVSLHEESSQPRNGWRQQFHQWNSTARRHNFFFQSETRVEQDNFGGSVWRDRSSSHRQGSAAFSPFDDEFFQPQKQPQEGRRWVRQAVVDFHALCVLYDQLTTQPELAGHVCFMAHQVAEKALKGAMYSECGLDGRSLMDHNLTRHALALQTVRSAETIGLAAHTVPLEYYYLDPRYPNRCPGSKIPAECFDLRKADEAKDHAQQVLKIVQKLNTP